jgi:hypothetical protein
MSETLICCPSCGARIALAVKEEQAELPLGPIGVSHPAPTVKRLIENTKRIESVNRNGEKIEPSSIIASCEEDLIETLRGIVGEREIRTNGGLWRYYFRECRSAILYAIEDWKLRTPDQQRLIKNRSAWLTDRYKRARNEIIKARQHLAAG